MGLMNTKIFMGFDLRQMSDSALLKDVVDVDVFAEIEPNQKERIILALRKLEMSWDIWETASTMPRRFMPPMSAFPLSPAGVRGLVKALSCGGESAAPPA
jgi:hypothetical protein